MPITSYDALSTAVISFMTDATDLSGPMPTLIMQAEQLIYHGMASSGGVMQPLRVRQMTTVTPLVPDANGVCPLPADFLQWQRVVATGPRKELEYIAPSAADQQYPTGEHGLSCQFTVIGNGLYTYPAIAVTSGVELTYYAMPPPLAPGTAEHQLLSLFPMLYLRATMAMAAEWLKDNGEMQTQMALLRGAISSLNREEQMVALNRAPLIFRRQVR